MSLAAHEELAKILRRTPAGIGEASLHMARRRLTQAGQAAAYDFRFHGAAGSPVLRELGREPAGRSLAIGDGGLRVPRSGTSMMMPFDREAAAAAVAGRTAAAAD